MARQAIARTQEKQVVMYNKGHKSCKFKSGDLVLVNPHELEWSEAKGEGAKLVQWWIGPFEITKQINLKMYQLQMDDCYRGTPIFSLDHLHRYVSSPEEFGEWAKLPDTWMMAPAEEYEVKNIIAHCWGPRKKIQYLVHWKGSNLMQDSWQTERDLHNAAELLCNYKRAAKI